MRRCLRNEVSTSTWLEDNHCDLLGKIVRARESFVAQRANVWSFLRVRAHVSKRPVSVYPTTKIAPVPNDLLYNNKMEMGKLQALTS